MYSNFTNVNIDKRNTMVQPAILHLSVWEEASISMEQSSKDSESKMKIGQDSLVSSRESNVNESGPPLHHREQGQ